MNNPIVTSYLYGWLMNAVGVLTGQKTGKVSDFTSFSDFMNSMSSSGFNGNITDPIETKAALWFYNYWGNYLSPQVGIMSFVWTILGWGVIALYNITATLENVFNNIFKLFGLFDYLSDPNSVIGKFYQGFQVLGIAIFTLLLTIQIVCSVFGKPFKYKDALLHFLLVTCVCAVLPATVVKVSSVLYTDFTNKQNGIENITGKSDTNSNKDTLAIQPVKSNVTDVLELVRGDFNTKKFPLDKYGNIKGNGTYNSITDDPNKRMTDDFITHMNFGASLGATDTDTLENLEKNAKMKGVKGLFLHYPSDTGASIKSVNEHRLLSGANMAEKVYPRYKTNFLAIYAQYIVLIILLALMSVKLVTSIFELLVTGLIAPIQGYSSVASHSKFKELLLTITGTIAGIYFEAIIMRIVLEIMRDFPTITMTLYDTNGNVVGKSAPFFSGLGLFGSTLTSIIVYLGLFFGAMRGVTIVERWLGVSVGQNDMAQQIMGAMIASNAITQTAKAVGNTGVGLAGAGITAAKQVPNVTNTVAGGLAKVGGVVAGVGDSIAQQGLGATVKGGLFNADDAVSDKLKGGIDNLKDNYQKGQTNANEALKNKYPNSDDLLKHPNAYYDDSYDTDNSDDDIPPENIVDDDGTEIPSTAPNIDNEEDLEHIDQKQGGVVDDENSKDKNASKNKDDNLGDDEDSLKKDGGLKKDKDLPQDEKVSQSANVKGASDSVETKDELKHGLESETSDTAKTRTPAGGLTDSDVKNETISKNPHIQEEKTDLDSQNEQVNALPESKETTPISPTEVSKTMSSGVKSEPTSLEEETESGHEDNNDKNMSSKTQPTTEEVQNNNPTRFQKAGTEYHQASQSLSQAVQYMSSGRSHIRGQKDDEDEQSGE